MITELPAEEQIVVANGERIAGRQARNRLAQALGGHRDSVYSWQEFSKHLSLSKRIIVVEVQAGRGLSIGADIGSLHVKRGMVAIDRDGQGIIPLLVGQHLSLIHI